MCNLVLIVAETIILVSVKRVLRTLWAVADFQLNFVEATARIKLNLQKTE